MNLQCMGIAMMKICVNRRRILIILLILSIGILTLLGISKYSFQKACLRREIRWPDLGIADDWQYEILTEAYKIKNEPNGKITITASDAGTKIWGGFDLKEANACAAVSKTSVPVLIIHGDKDKTAPVSMAYKIYNSCKSERELYIVSGAEHTGCYRTDPEKYKMIVSEFIEKHIPQ